MPAFTYLVVSEGPSWETQPGSTGHLIPQQTRTGCFRVTTGLNKRVEAPTRRLLTSFCLDDVCCCPTGPIEPQVRIIVGEMIQVVDTERHRSLEPFYISLPQNLLSRSST